MEGYKMEMRVYDIYEDMLNQTHLLIAGATGSGKSVVINGMIFNAMFNAPDDAQFILVDPKRVELVMYRDLPHTMVYASEPHDMVKALETAIEKVDTRYKYMQRVGLRKYDGGHIYVVIDELADLMTTNKREVQPLIQRLCQIGRAANVHVIAATQCPLASIIPTAIKVNFDSRVGLRTRSAQDSRNILGETGCEKLPRYGYGYYMTAEGCKLHEIPMYSGDEIKVLVDYWTKPRRATA
jgi:S-DNA-T family DNA segregation ATPase FtsK/SpoIIIE